MKFISCLIGKFSFLAAIIMGKTAKRKNVKNSSPNDHVESKEKTTEDSIKSNSSVRGNWSNRAIVARNINTGVYDINSSRQKVASSPTRQVPSKKFNCSYLFYSSLFVLLAAGKLL
jgi:predicted transcriptional regulator YheO